MISIENVIPDNEINQEEFFLLSQVVALINKVHYLENELDSVNKNYGQACDMLYKLRATPYEDALAFFNQIYFGPNPESRNQVSGVK